MGNLLPAYKLIYWFIQVCKKFQIRVFNQKPPSNKSWGQTDCGMTPSKLYALRRNCTLFSLQIKTPQRPKTFAWNECSNVTNESLMSCYTCISSGFSILTSSQYTVKKKVNPLHITTRLAWLWCTQRYGHASFMSDSSMTIQSSSCDEWTTQAHLVCSLWCLFCPHTPLTVRAISAAAVHTCQR